MPWNGQEHSHRKARLCVFFSDFKKWCVDVSFLISISMSTVVLSLGKVEFFKWIHLRNILFIGFVKFEIKQWFSAYQDQVCAWFSFARLPTETAGIFFLDHFLKETALSFFFWLLEPVQCLGKTQFFVPYLLPSHIKYYYHPNSQNFPPF